MKLLPNLNILRLVLAMVVILHHVAAMAKSMHLPYYDALPIFSKGGEAVKFFFTLSGFLIIRLLYLEKTETHTISIKKFYTRRALKILPVYILVILIGVFISHVAMPLAGVSKITHYTFGQLAFYFIFMLPNVFDILFEPGGVFLVLWSIGIEEQFYLFIPLVLFIIKPKYITASLITLLVFYLVFFNLLPDLRRFQMMYFYFLFGGLVSLHYDKLGFLKNNLVRILVTLVVFIHFFTNYFMGLPIAYYQLIAMIDAGLFITMIAYYPPFAIENKFMNYLGKISYGIYMYHLIVLMFVLFLYMKVFAKFNMPNLVSALAINIVTIAITFILAHLSFKYFEAYFLRLKKKEHANPLPKEATEATA